MGCLPLFVPLANHAASMSLLGESQHYANGKLGTVIRIGSLILSDDLPSHSRRLRRESLALIFLLSAALLFAACGKGGAIANSKNSNRSASNSNTNNHELVDVNSASKYQLIQLPGIGEAHAQKIIDGRPYREKSDLVKKNIISQKTYEMIADKVIARQN